MPRLRSKLESTMSPTASLEAEAPANAVEALHAPPLGLSQAPPAEVFALLESRESGLNAAEVGMRLAANGFNELPHPVRTPVALRFLRQFVDFFAVMLLAAALVTFVTYLFPPHDAGNLQLAGAILAVVLLNAWIGFIQEYTAERTAEALKALVPAQARAIRGGVLVEVPVRSLVRGDVILLDAGDAVPCDARVVEAHRLRVDISSLTGESRPVTRDAEASESAGGPDAPNLIFMGTSLVVGSCRAVVFATGLDTELGHVFKLTTGTRPSPSPLQLQVAVMARRVAVIAVVTGVVVFGLRTATSTVNLTAAFLFALGVMVALVPEGLPATLSVALAVGVRRMARRHALIKKLLAVEALGSATVICTDKTGTLTTAEMTVQAVWESGRLHMVSGVGYEPRGSVQDPAAVEPVLRAAALCSDAQVLGPDPGRNLGWRILGDPTEGAIVVAAAKTGFDRNFAQSIAPRTDVIPFDPARKLMTTVHRQNDGWTAYVKGSPQELLARSESVAWGGRDVYLGDDLRARIAQANDGMASAAMRVLGVARRTVSSPKPGMSEAESRLTFMGLIGMIDPPRPEVREAVRRCERAGIRVVMVTGDYGLTGEAIARSVGIVKSARPRVMTAADLDAIDDPALDRILGEWTEVLFARVKPEHKLRVVRSFKRLGQIVAVTGDGVNDGPALKTADIGIAMGRSGTDVAREAAQMILLDDSLASIVAAIELGRSVYQNIRKFLVYLFSHNLAELAPILAGYVVAFPLAPLTALQILAIDLGSDVMPALALGTEAPEPGIMDRPPRNPAESLFSRQMLGRLLFLGSIQSIGVVFAFFWKIHSAGIPMGSLTANDPIYREALTMTQAGIVVSQFFNGLVVRTDFASVFRVGLLSNWRLVVGEVCGVAIVAAISYVPFLEGIFHTAPLSALDWAVLAAFGLLLFVAEEARKLVLRRIRRARPDAPGGQR